MANAPPESDGGSDESRQRRANADALRQEIAKLKGGQVPKPAAETPRDFIERKMAEERKKAEQRGDGDGDNARSK